MRENLRPGVEAALQNISQSPLGPLLNQNSAMKVWNDFLRQKTSWSRVWSLYVLERWCELNSIAAERGMGRWRIQTVTGAGLRAEFKTTTRTGDQTASSAVLGTTRLEIYSYTV